MISTPPPARTLRLQPLGLAKVPRRRRAVGTTNRRAAPNSYRRRTIAAATARRLPARGTPTAGEAAPAASAASWIVVIMAPTSIAPRFDGCSSSPAKSLRDCQIQPALPHALQCEQECFLSTLDLRGTPELPVIRQNSPVPIPSRVSVRQLLKGFGTPKGLGRYHAACRPQRKNRRRYWTFRNAARRPGSASPAQIIDSTGRFDSEMTGG